MGVISGWQLLHCDENLAWHADNVNNVFDWYESRAKSCTDCHSGLNVTNRPS